MENEFRKLAGLDNDDGAARNPVAAAKAGLAVKRAIPREPEICLALIDKVLRKKPGTALVVSAAHFIAPRTNDNVPLPQNERVNIERLRTWSHDEGLRKNGSIVLMLTDQASKISQELRQSGNEISTVLIPKPDKDERRAFIQYLIVKSKAADSLHSPFIFPDDFDIDVFINATQGLSLRQILDIFLHAKKTGRTINLEYVKAKKYELLNEEYGDVMEVVEPRRGLEDIGGHEHIKSYMREVLEGLRRSDDRAAMGIIYMGPPGTGKTALVEALAYEAHFHFVKTRNIRSPWVGASEDRQEKMIQGLHALAPVVVMNDEADLNDANRDAPKGDSGVSERLMKKWMEFLSDPRIRGKIIVISCTNRPDRIDPALKRSGRSDERILMPMPSQDEIPAILRVMFTRHKVDTDITDFAFYVELLEGLSGADIEKIVLGACGFASRRGESRVNDSALREAIADFIPSASQAEIDRMTLLCLLECSSRRLLHPRIMDIVLKIKARNLVENLDVLLEQLRARAIVSINN